MNNGINGLQLIMYLLLLKICYSVLLLLLKKIPVLKIHFKNPYDEIFDKPLTPL